jgi:hypothetical protein
LDRQRDICYVFRRIPVISQGKGEDPMPTSRSIAATITLALCLAISSQAGPTTKPSADQKAKPVRLFKPWSDMKSLSDEQRGKIHEIRLKVLEEERALEKKEHDDIVALLSDDQKKELADVENSAKAGKKPKTPDMTASEEKKD